MERDQELDYIRETYRDLTEDITSSLKIGNIIDKLFEKHFIEDGEYRRLSNLVHEDKSTEASRIFLSETLLRDPDPKSFHKFVLLLMSRNQQCLAGMLKEKYESVCRERETPTVERWLQPKLSDCNTNGEGTDFVNRQGPRIGTPVQEVGHEAQPDHSTNQLAVAALNSSDQTDVKITDTSSDLGTQQLVQPAIARNMRYNEPNPTDSDPQVSIDDPATQLSQMELSELKSISPQSRDGVTGKEPALVPPTVEAADNNTPTQAPPTAEAAANNTPTQAPPTAEAADNNTPTQAPPTAEAADNNTPTQAPPTAEATNNNTPTQAHPTAEAADNNTPTQAPPTAEAADNNTPSQAHPTFEVAASNASTEAHPAAEVAPYNASSSESAHQPVPMDRHRIELARLGFNRSNILGSGRFGVVYKCEYNSTPIAVKEVRDVGDEDSLPEFLASCKELKACIYIRHPYIVQLMGFSTAEFGDDTTLLLVFEFVEGNSLKKLLHGRGKNKKEYPLDNDAKYKIAVQLVTAIAFIHGQHLQIIHGDIKPDNVLITPQNNVKLCDLGLCKIKRGDPAMTTIGKPRGTPIYMAPELLLKHDWYTDFDHAVSFKTDIFSLGVTLYELFERKYMWDISSASQGQGNSLAVLTEKMKNRDLPKILKDPQEKQPYHIIAECVNQAPTDRPDAVKVLGVLRKHMNRK